MRRHLLCKAQLQDAMQFLKRWSTNSTSAFCINVHSSARSQYSAPGPCMLSRSSFQRVLATTSLASQDSTIDELHVTSSTTNTSNSMDFPGGRVPFTDRLDFEGGPFTQRPPLSCYRTLDSKGHSIPNAQIAHPLNQDLALRMYTNMVKLQTVDVIFYEAQRQGRFSFFMTSNGEEATAIGSAAALSAEDHVFSQYREHGVLLYRGFSFLSMANQCFGNVRGHGKGRQMPIHYGSKAHNFQTVSAPLATQMPHAVGAAHALKMQGQKVVVAVYFGEGAASEGDFHAALNFAATLSAPVLFICRNNGWAISTPATEQYRGDGIAGRGPSYGIPTIRVDGGDARAVYNATLEARAIALEHSCPVLIEAMSYRSGHHSTSDDSSRYRTAEEMQEWRARDPVTRFQAFLDEAGWWDLEQEKGLRIAVRKEVVEALTAAQKVGKPPLSDLFSDVYKDMPWHLAEQQEDAFKHAQQHPDCLHGVPLS